MSHEVHKMTGMSYRTIMGHIPFMNAFINIYRSAAMEVFSGLSTFNYIQWKAFLRLKETVQDYYIDGYNIFPPIYQNEMLTVAGGCKRAAASHMIDQFVILNIDDATIWNRCLSACQRCYSSYSISAF